MTMPEFLDPELVVAVVTELAARCDHPTLAALTTTGDAVIARPEMLPSGTDTADSLATVCADMARLIARHPAVSATDVAGYAVILPDDSVAFAADRSGFIHFIELPEVPTESVYSHRWDELTENVMAMVDALAR